jgi:rubrerythrin
MDSAHEGLIGALRSIRDQADSILQRIEQRAEQKSLAWRCVACGRTKHFTRAAPAEAAAPCPKCGGEKFAPA